MVFLIQKTLLYTIPLLIVAMAGMFAERSGIINIALDGIMIFGSFVGALVTRVLVEHAVLAEAGDRHWRYLVGMLVSALAGAVFSLLLSFSAIKLKADQTIGGTALNLLAPALTLFVVKILYMQDKLEMPAAYKAPVMYHEDMGAVGRTLFDKAYVSTFVVIVLYIVLSVLLYKTKFGLRLRACGEHPQAADSVGINVIRMRYIGTTISGALGGLGGYIFIVTSAGGTSEGTVAGMGFLALAIMIFGNWKPVGIALGSLLFGFLKCLGVIANSLDINGDGVCALAGLGLPMYFYSILPYVAVLVVLAFTSKRSRAPKAEGIPYDKGMR